MLWEFESLIFRKMYIQLPLSEWLGVGPQNLQHWFESNMAVIYIRKLHTRTNNDIEVH